MSRPTVDTELMSVFEFKQKYFPRALREGNSAKGARPAFLDSLAPKIEADSKRTTKRDKTAK